MKARYSYNWDKQVTAYSSLLLHWRPCFIGGNIHLVCYPGLEVMAREIMS